LYNSYLLHLELQLLNLYIKKKLKETNVSNTYIRLFAKKYQIPFTKYFKNTLKKDYDIFFNKEDFKFFLYILNSHFLGIYYDNFKIINLYFYSKKKNDIRIFKELKKKKENKKIIFKLIKKVIKFNKKNKKKKFYMDYGYEDG